MYTGCVEDALCSVSLGTVGLDGRAETTKCLVIGLEARNPSQLKKTSFGRYILRMMYVPLCSFPSFRFRGRRHDKALISSPPICSGWSFPSDHTSYEACFLSRRPTRSVFDGNEDSSFRSFKCFGLICRK